MANTLERFLNKRRNRSSTSSDESRESPEAKKPKNLLLVEEHAENAIAREPEKDEILTALDMSADVASKLQEILQKLEKLDDIESSLRKIENNLQNLERRTERLEAFHSSAKGEIIEMQKGISSHDKDLEELKTKEAECDKNLVILRDKLKEQEDKLADLHMKNLYLEAYSRRENIKFINIAEKSTTAHQEDTEEVLRCFLEQDLGFADARNVEIQRVHRTGRFKEGETRPILARFLRYQDCEHILARGHRLKGTGYQMFRDLPAEIIEKRRPQVETLKRARRSGLPANFSASKPDKLYIKGKLWPVGKEFVA